MGVIRGKHDPDFTYFSFVSILGIYRLVSFCLLCCYIPSTVEIPRLSRTRQGSGDWPVHFGRTGHGICLRILYSPALSFRSGAGCVGGANPHQDISLFSASLFWGGDAAGDLSRLSVEGTQSASTSRRNN